VGALTAHADKSGRATPDPPVITRRQQFRVTGPAGTVVHLTLFGRHWLAFATGPSPSQPTNKLELVNLATGSIRVLARSHWHHGLLDWVEGTGNYVTWTDAASGNGPDSNVKWRLYGENVVTGHRFVIARNARGHPSPNPLPRARDGYVTWGQAVGSHLRLYAERLGSGRAMAIVRYATYLTDSGVTRGWLTYDTGRPNHHRLMEVRLTGGPPRPVSPSGRVADPRAACGRVVWQQPQSGDPTGLFESPLTHPEPVRVIDGESDGNTVVGSNFLAYWSYPRGNVSLAALAHDARSTAVSGSNTDTPARLSATCHRVAFAVDQPAQRGTVLRKPQSAAVLIEVLSIKH
jgi:hypothetical protein